jgi:hypothetical protein
MIIQNGRRKKALGVDFVPVTPVAHKSHMACSGIEEGLPQ